MSSEKLYLTALKLNAGDTIEMQINGKKVDFAVLGGCTKFYCGHDSDLHLYLEPEWDENQNTHPPHTAGASGDLTNKEK